ncbi:sigma factor-like helix-turn-helix DNA-binding protein [Ruminococcus champanellensis]
MILYYFQGLTYEQIAEMEGCTFQAVAKSVAAAEKRLKNFFGIGG